MASSKRKRAAVDAVSATQPKHKRPKKSSDSSNKTPAATHQAPVVLDKILFSDNPKGDERKREASLYELLGSEDENDRLVAADVVVSCLLDDGGVSEAVLRRHLDKRLFRGLASGRNASRLGFSLVLTEILRQLFGVDDLASSRYPGLPFTQVLDILVQRTQAVGNITGQEERDHYFGQLFGIESFVHAGILFGEKARWVAVLDLLLRLAKKKSWLRSQCGWVITQSMQQMPQKLAEKTLKRVAEEDLSKTPEGVGIVVAAIGRFPEMKVPSKPWRDPLSPKHLTELSAILRENRETSSIDGAGIRNQKQGNRTAQLPFVWDIILAHFTKHHEIQIETLDQFRLFWTKVVDAGFFSKSASDSQKFSGFLIFQKYLEGSVRHSFITWTLFSKNLMSCLINQASKEDRYLHRAALKTLKSLDLTVQQEPSILVPVLTQILGEHGAYNFDQRTNTKTVEKLLKYTSSSNFSDVLAIIKSTNNLEPPLSLQTYGNYLFNLATLPIENAEVQADGYGSVAAQAIQELAKIAFSKSEESSLLYKTRDMLRNRLMSAFAKLAAKPENFVHLCNAVLSIEVDVSTHDEIQEGLTGALERLEVLLNLENSAAEVRLPSQSLALLHAVGILQLYNEDPDALETLEDLGECVEKFNQRALTNDFSQLLVEILLAMVAQPSSLMRQVSLKVFEAFTHTMSVQAIRLLTDTLLAEENSKGRQTLFSTEDEDLNGSGASDSDSHSSEDAFDSDVEVVDIAANALNGAADSNEEAFAEADGDEEDLEALDIALGNILKTHRLDKDDDASSSDGSDMTDSEMLQLDEKLVEIFKQRTKTHNSKKQHKGAKESVVNFKHRVLDLIGIFVKQEAAKSNLLAFRILVPLLQLIWNTSTKPLASKACDLILSFSKHFKKARGNQQPSTDDTEKMVLCELLQQIHDEATKDQSHVLAKAASAASLAVSSGLCAWFDSANFVFEQYAATQLKWYRGEVKMQPSFFSDWVNWCQGHAQNAAGQSKEQDENGH